MKVLVTYKVPQECVKIFKNASIEAVIKPNISPADLKKEISEYAGIILRSETKITAEILGNAGNLKVICRAGVGVDNIDVVAASKKGIVVMNAPGGNIVSTAEHTLTMLLALSRNIAPAYISLKAGKWDRKRFIGTQIAGKTLGIIGLGRVGRQVAKRASALEMKVIGYDPFISPDASSQLHVHVVGNLDALLTQSDYVTVHVPLNNETKNLIAKRAFDLMKDGVRIVNCARGGIISEEALYNAIVDGKVAGAALDVFEIEPPVDNKLLGLEQVLATPHLGASTEEAQLAVTMEAAQLTIDALTGKGIHNAVNMPVIHPEEFQRLRPFTVLAEKMGSVLVQLSHGGLRSIDVAYCGDVSNEKETVWLLTNSLLVGLLRPALDEGVNLVSIPIIVAERGIKVNETITSCPSNFTNLVYARIHTDDGERSVAGTVFDMREARIVEINGYSVEAIPDGHMLILFGKDRPGLIGHVGKILGDQNINIARMTFGRKETGGNAIIVLNVDQSLSQDTLDAIRRIENIESVHLIRPL
ncbi:MAG: phosphoglycerate dehydrogenase [Planctomycetes bacterium]|nr:phosphoglycerate dehydrogenase [Planctomycetota bacterium]